MQLVLAEKPSVGMSLSKVLGAKSRRDGYMEGNGWLVSWCVGHLVDLVNADAYDPRYSKWAYEDLPIIPTEWQYKVLPDTRKQFDILSALMADERVESLVCATDAGREGELIFRLVYKKCGCKKPVKRLWISSMEDSAILKGFDNLLDSKNYDNLYEAALCRSKADWLVGINGTRLFTTLYRGKTLNVGRVITPTLALLTEREAAIAGFKKEKFYTVELGLKDFQVASETFSSKTDAEKLRTACVGKPVTVKSVTTVDKKENPPKLYDLTTLQREANRLLNYTAQQTLDCVQLLYEKKLVTYPRTDSRYLTSDMEAGLPDLCQAVASALSFVRKFPVNAAQVINDSKVTDHHAIVPTAEIGNADFAALPTGERNILRMIASRLLCAVGEPYTYQETSVVLDCNGVSFTAKGKHITSDGWKATEKVFISSLQKLHGNPKEPAVIPEFSEGQQLTCEDASVHTGTSSPPSRFTEDTLLSAMERASAEDFAKMEDVEHAGLGTPATRAGIIEKLVRTGFIERKGKQLLPTEKGKELIKVMPKQLTSAKLTAEWEEKLGEIERGELSPDAFMADIKAMLTDLVGTYKGVSVASSALSNTGRTVIGICPRCGKNVYEGKKSFFCEAWNTTPPCGFAMWKNDHFFTNKNKELTKKVAAALLKDGRVRMTKLFSEQTGVFYDATVILNDDGGKYVHYKLEFDKKKKE